jgi:hypothetical protein
VNAKDPAGETVLDWARKAGNTPAVAMLKRAGAVESPTPHQPSRRLRLLTCARPHNEASRFWKRRPSAPRRTAGARRAIRTTLLMSSAAWPRAKGLQVDEKAAADRLALTRAPYFAPLNMLERFDAAGSPEFLSTRFMRWQPWTQSRTVSSTA